MLRGLAIAAAVSSAACSATPADPAPAPPEAAPSVASAPESKPAVPTFGSISADRLRVHVETLATDEMAGRATPSPELDRAAEYIAARFEASGLGSPPGARDYRQRFRCGRDAGQSANVVARLQGRDASVDDAVIVSAHYDHLGTRDVAPDEDGIYNGANDNASGVAALIEIADAFAKLDRPPRRSVVFIAFCGEELGLRGSRHYVSEPPWPLEDMVAMVNLEMLGRASSSDPVQAWVTGMELSDLGTMLAGTTGSTGVQLVPSTQIGVLESNTFARSDNYPFAQAGIVAHTIAAGRLDEHYHSADDETSTLNFDAMAAIVRAIAVGLHHVAEDPIHPDWSEAGRAEGLTAR